jgi:DNA-binding winged helix-turn-helix (wHTH) protein/TolB-like protein
MTKNSEFLLRDWRVDPDRNRLIGPDGPVRLTPRTMAVLLLMAERAGQVVSRDQFSEQIWHPTVVTDDALNRCISELRRAFGDNTRAPRFIETIPKRGYRLVAPVKADAPAATTDEASEVTEELQPPVPPSDFTPSWPRLAAVAGGIFLILVAALLLQRFNASQDDPTDQGIAVLPFQTIGTEPTLPLADGMHYDLLSRLSAIPTLRVISSSSVARYGQRDWTTAEIAADLQVGWILHGTVQQQGDRIQVNAQLINADRDAHQWARTYRRDLSADNLFALQGELIEDIARSLSAEVGFESAEQPSQAPTRNLEAYTLFTRARTLLAKRSAVDMAQAIALFEAALNIDPGYAQAWAALADAHALMAYYDYGEPEALIARARESANRALDLEPDQARAHVVLGIARLIGARDVPGALALLQRARELDRQFTGWLGWTRAVAGELQSALDHARDLYRSDPLSAGALYTLAQMEFLSGELDSALEHTCAARRQSPGYARAHLLEAQILLSLSQHAEALAALERGLAHSPIATRNDFRTWQVVARLRDGQPVDAEALSAQLTEQADWFNLGILQWESGQSAAAFQTLASTPWSDIETLDLRFNPLLALLRSDPRYVELQKSLDQWWGL